MARMDSNHFRLPVLAVLVALFALPVPAEAVPVQPGGIVLAGTSNTGIQFSWNAVTSATKYRVAIATQRNMGNARLAYTPERWYTATHLKPGVTYYFSFRTVNADGISAPSPVFAMHTTKTVVGLTLTKLDQFSMYYRWIGWIGAAKYEIRLASRADMKYARSQVLTARDTHFSSLKNGTTYYAQVRALGTSGSPMTAWSPSKVVKFTPPS